MPTYINESRPQVRNYSNLSNQLDIDRYHTYYNNLQGYELDCKQILQHIQNCPVCQHVFALKTQPAKIMTAVPSFNSFQSTPSGKIEISTSTLILLSVFIVIFSIYIIKTSRI